MGQISINSFRIKGDLFNTDAIRLYCKKTGIESVSSLEEIDILEEKVMELMNNDESCFISSQMDKRELARGYFTALRFELRKFEA